MIEHSDKKGNALKALESNPFFCNQKKRNFYSTFSPEKVTKTLGVRLKNMMKTNQLIHCILRNSSSTQTYSNSQELVS